jgi:20S proteasome alpha/beta subunit
MMRFFAALFVVFYISLLVAQVEGSSNAAGQETLIGIVGKDFVLLGADTSASSGGGGIALAASNVDKIYIVRETEPSDAGCLAVAPAGSSGDVDRLMGLLQAHVVIREYDSGMGSDVECVFSGRKGSKVKAVPSFGLTPASLSHFARTEIASSLRSRTPYSVCLLVAGMERRTRLPGASSTYEGLQPSPNTGMRETHSQQLQGQVASVTKQFQDGTQSSNENEEEPNVATKARPGCVSYIPRLFWIDSTGAMHNVQYGSHGLGSNFLLSILDKGYKPNMSRDEAMDLMKDCFNQLRTRCVINSGPYPPCIKCIDAVQGSTILSGSMEKHET